MFSKSEPSISHLDPTTAEKLADVLFEIGRDLLQKKVFPMAVRWLERAHNVLGGQELDKLSMDAGELRLSVMHSLSGLLPLKLLGSDIDLHTSPGTPRFRRRRR